MIEQRQTSLFSGIWREIRKNFIKNSQKNAKFDEEAEFDHRAAGAGRVPPTQPAGSAEQSGRLAARFATKDTIE